MPKMAVMAQKGRAIHMLNEHLRSQPLQTSDAAVAGVVQLIVDEWYWGETADLKAHLRGLRQMIQLRGGFQNLGMHGILAKLVIRCVATVGIPFFRPSVHAYTGRSHDLGIALAHEISPFLLGSGAEFEFEDPMHVHFRLAHNTPFLPTLASFASCAQPLGLHDTTASILDDVRFILAAVMALSPEPAAQELRKVATTAQWMLDRIQKLDSESPEPKPNPAEAEPPSRKGSTASTSPDTASRRSTPSDTRSSSSSPPADVGPRPDYMYRVVRLAALIMLRAILKREPLSATCTASEFLEVWLLSWRVPLTVWRATIGVFNWMLFTIIPASHGGPHDRFVRTMWMISMVSRGVENWHVTLDSARVGLRLHRWLAGENLNGKGPEAGGGVVAKYGYHAPRW
jgi:hypothetical protein